MEQRRTRRFQLQLPLSITRNGAERVAFPGRTKNISSSGVLFTTEAEPDLTGGSIEYVITLNHEGPQTVNLRCVGKVVRCQRDDGSFSDHPLAYQIAATLERYEFVREH
jgi:PilZ domain-containing protein